MENRFSNFNFFHVVSWVFFKSLNIAIYLQILSSNTVAQICRCHVSRCFVVNEEESSWPGVNQRVLRMYAAKPYQFEPTYTLLSTERRKKHFYTMVISSKNIRWHPNSVPQCWDRDLLTKLLFNNITKCNMQKILWKSILHTFIRFT